jgi:two-component system, response regulator RpfG
MGEPRASVKSTVVPLASSTVMVIDDQSTSRAILEQVLRTLDERIMVKSFARPIDAVVWATRHVADLVLVDYAMPEMNGTDLARRLRAMPGYELVPIVMVTVNDEREVRYNALDAGVTDFLAKPVDVRECLARCRNLLTLRRAQLALEDRQKLLEQVVENSARELREREREKQTLIQLAQGATARPAPRPRVARSLTYAHRHPGPARGLARFVPRKSLGRERG